jgi:hypothetical protein
MPEVETTEFFPGVTRFSDGRAIEWRFVRGSFVDAGPALVWGRPRMPLVAGDETAGLEALLVLLDSANGASAERDIRTHALVVVDLGLNPHRHPVGRVAPPAIADDQ